MVRIRNKATEKCQEHYLSPRQDGLEERKWKKRFINYDLLMTTLVIITHTNFRRKTLGLDLWYPKIPSPPTFEHHASSQFSSPLFPYIQMKPARNILYAPKAYFIYILDEAEHQCCVYMLCLKTTERILSSNNFRRIILNNTSTRTNIALHHLPQYQGK